MLWNSNIYTLYLLITQVWRGTNAYTPLGMPTLKKSILGKYHQVNAWEYPSKVLSHHLIYPCCTTARFCVHSFSIGKDTSSVSGDFSHFYPFLLFLKPFPVSNYSENYLNQIISFDSNFPDLLVILGAQYMEIHIREGQTMFLDFQPQLPELGNKNGIPMIPPVRCKTLVFASPHGKQVTQKGN